MSILDSILDIILNRKRPKQKDVKFLKPRFRPQMKYPLIIPEKAEEKTGFDSILTSIGRAISNIGFFAILLPGILAGRKSRKKLSVLEFQRFSNCLLTFININTFGQPCCSWEFPSHSPCLPGPPSSPHSCSPTRTSPCSHR